MGSMGRCACGAGLRPDEMLFFASAIFDSCFDHFSFFIAFFILDLSLISKGSRNYM